MYAGLVRRLEAPCNARFFPPLGLGFFPPKNPVLRTGNKEREGERERIIGLRLVAPVATVTAPGARLARASTPRAFSSCNLLQILSLFPQDLAESERERDREREGQGGTCSNGKHSFNWITIFYCYMTSCSGPLHRQGFLLLSCCCSIHKAPLISRVLEHFRVTTPSCHRTRAIFPGAPLLHQE